MKRENDGENGLTKLIQALATQIPDGLSTLYAGEVKKVSPPTVSVQPITLTRNNKKQAMVQSARVGIPPIKIPDHYGEDGSPKKWVRPKLEIKPGDQVIVGVFDHDMQNYKGQSSMRVADSTSHRITNSVVLLRIATGDDFDG